MYECKDLGIDKPDRCHTPCGMGPAHDPMSSVTWVACDCPKIVVREVERKPEPKPEPASDALTYTARYSEGDPW